MIINNLSIATVLPIGEQQINMREQNLTIQKPTNSVLPFATVLLTLFMGYPEQPKRISK